MQIRKKVCNGFRQCCKPYITVRNGCTLFCQSKASALNSPQKESEMKRIRISNETLNSYGTWIRTDGVDMAQYLRNPVLLWMHYRGRIIGCMKDVRVENGEITGEPYFDEVLEESRTAKAQYEKGTLRMASAGFDIIETSDDPAQLKPGQTRPTVTRSKLVEVSMVDIGGNDDSIVLSYGGKRLTLSAGEDSGALPLLEPKTKDFINLKNRTSMNEQLRTIALMLGLADSATLAEVQREINLLLGYKSANGMLRTEKESLQKEIDTLRLSGIASIVDEAVAAGKIDAVRKAHFIELGKKIGQESLKLTFEAMHAAVRPSALLGGGNARTDSNSGGWKKLSEVPAEELKLIRENDRQQYRRLYKAEYGIDCPEFK